MAASIREIGNNTELDRVLNKVFTTQYRTGYVEVGEDKVCLPIYYQEHEEKIRKFEVRDEDVFLFGIAKSGTTWCHELLWLLVNNLNYEGAKVPSGERNHILEMPILYDFKNMEFPVLCSNDYYTVIEGLQSPRCIKSHLNWSLLPEQIRDGSKKPKIIWLYRDPKDTCVSHYHQARLAAGYKGTFEEFSELYLGGRVPYGPFWKYVLSFWQQRHRPNILFIKYADMKADFALVIKKVAKFLEKPIKEENLAKLMDYLSVEAMKKNPATNQKEIVKEFDEKYQQNTSGGGEFVRTGKVGDHASLMSPDIIAKFDAWTKKNLSGTDFNADF